MTEKTEALDMGLVHEQVDKWLEDNEVLAANSNAAPSFLWLDIETTGLDASSPILEIGLMVTNSGGYVVKDGLRSWVVNIGPVRHLNLGDYVRNMHTANGLLDEIKTGVVLSTVADEMIAFIKKHFGDKKVPLSGSSVHKDREWLGYHIPAVLDAVHYRIIDISSVKELVRELNPVLLDLQKAEEPPPMGAHRVIPDLIDTIEEFRFYRTEFMWTSDDFQRINSED